MPKPPGTHWKSVCTLLCRLDISPLIETLTAGFSKQTSPATLHMCFLYRFIDWSRHPHQGMSLLQKMNRSAYCVCCRLFLPMKCYNIMSFTGGAWSNHFIVSWSFIYEMDCQTHLWCVFILGVFRHFITGFTHAQLMETIKVHCAGQSPLWALANVLMLYIRPQLHTYITYWDYVSVSDQLQRRTSHVECWYPLWNLIIPFPGEAFWNIHYILEEISCSHDIVPRIVCQNWIWYIYILGGVKHFSTGFPKSAAYWKTTGWLF